MQMTRNILRVYRRASESQHKTGMEWYSEAHNLALSLSPDDVWRGAGVIAAYSPLTPWWRNVELATTSLVWGGARTDALGNAVKAAQRIIEGEHPFDVFKGPKVRCFTENIALNGVSDNPTIDSHAYSIAINSHTFSTKVNMGIRRYREIQDAYRRAAKRADISPTQMQAITWCVWRDENLNRAARKEV